jgi:hypothetical protein
VLGEILGPEDVEDYEGENGPGPVIHLGHAYPHGVKDALTRARAGRDHEQRPLPGMQVGLGTVMTPRTQAAELERYRTPSDGPAMKGINPGAEDEGRACDLPPEPGGRLDGKPTRDGRAMARVRNYLPGTNRGISTADYAEGLKKGREAMAAQAQAPAARARMTAAEFAALHAKKRAV